MEIKSYSNSLRRWKIRFPVLGSDPTLSKLYIDTVLTILYCTE